MLLLVFNTGLKLLHGHNPLIRLVTRYLLGVPQDMLAAHFRDAVQLPLVQQMSQGSEWGHTQSPDLSVLGM